MKKKARKPTLTAEEKAEHVRQRMIEKSHEMQTSTYSAKFVAPEFQRMIRAEAAAKPAGWQRVIAGGRMIKVHRCVGECVCVTCGKVSWWTSDARTMNTGHFLASRRFSILFEEDNVAPQCSYCNRHLGGAPKEYRLWMLEMRGEKVVERLEKLKATSRQFTGEELVDMLISYKVRLEAAEERMI